MGLRMLAVSPTVEKGIRESEGSPRLPAPTGPCLQGLPSARALARRASIYAPQWLLYLEDSAPRVEGQALLLPSEGKRHLLRSCDMPDTRLSPLPPLFLIYLSNDVTKQTSVFPFYKSKSTGSERSGVLPKVTPQSGAELECTFKPPCLYVGVFHHPTSVASLQKACFTVCVLRFSK
uniref:Uncharacterized protein n=1 Tax=Molossus molossus TaxID=27622 RepID=A0A7J8DBR5_MOLMO|nr:hypothetical protein HJG59_009357 [Molossus molossus]